MVVLGVAGCGWCGCSGWFCYFGGCGSWVSVEQNVFFTMFRVVRSRGEFTWCLDTGKNIK